MQKETKEIPQKDVNRLSGSIFPLGVVSSVCLPIRGNQTPCHTSLNRAWFERCGYSNIKNAVLL